MAGALLGATTANADTKIDDTHVRVEAGDTVSGIANKYGTDVSTIASASQLSDANKIFVGDILVLTPEAQQLTTNTVQTPVATNQSQPASQATVNTQTQPAQTQPAQSQAPVQQSTTPVQSQPATSAVSGSEQSAKEWIASRESGGSYGATNGRYVGRYQLDASYLNGDYSEANQERVAQQYVTNRYGSWANAQSFWQSHGWY
jgi:hypothetical protein